MMPNETNIFVKICEGVSDSLVKGIVAVILAGGVLGVSHMDSKQAATTAQANAESGTNWIGKNLLDSHNEIWSNNQAFVSFTNDVEKRFILLESRAR